MAWHCAFGEFLEARLAASSQTFVIAATFSDIILNLGFLELILADFLNLLETGNANTCHFLDAPEFCEIPEAFYAGPREDSPLPKD